MSLLAQIGAYIDSLVHPSARLGPLTAARHRAFIAPRLIGGLIALTALPIHLALSGVPSTLEILFYAWLATPILVAYYLSRTGNYDAAQLASSASMTVLIAVVSLASGGIASFAAVWLVVVPLEAALSASRRVVLIASAMALAAAAGVYVMGQPSVFASAAASLACADRGRNHFCGALCGRARTRQRVTRAYELAPARGGRGPLSLARA